MNTWHVTVTLDIAPPDADTLHEIVRALPAGAGAGRSPYGPHLRVSLTLHADYGDHAVQAATLLARHALASLAIERMDEAPPSVLGVEVLRNDEHSRRADLVSETGIPPLYSTKQAAELLGLHVSAIRQRAERGSIPAEKVGDAGWVFPAAAIDTLAAANGDGRPSRRAAAEQSD